MSGGRVWPICPLDKDTGRPSHLAHTASCPTLRKSRRDGAASVVMAHGPAPGPLPRSLPPAEPQGTGSQGTPRHRHRAADMQSSVVFYGSINVPAWIEFGVVTLFTVIALIKTVSLSLPISTAFPFRPSSVL